ncbi:MULTISPECIES: sporulation protein [unclassified Crossiella]|uniref:sporulation protein n=1 Tax=unclassified Crossiella TaxID=2620835 RepID=UPI001FFF9823|nr:MULTISPECIES: sporulation protein [unclassified Crossiella]MCK2241288.1 sporulation protein [Crossiella sp. S99.2]MCK2253568.1 sporulation protein [Crossiella sp. S99.1]
MFKRMLQAFGVGGPTVDTVLHDPNCRPGGQLSGEVRLSGGSSDVEIEHVTLSLVTRMEVEHGDSEHNTAVEFFRVAVAGRFQLREGEQRSIPFQLPVPWETPLTIVGGAPLRGMSVGVRTELSVAKAVDKGDLDAVHVHPLPSQDAVLEAFGRLGFQFRNADVERGHLHGVRQELPFYQEIEFFPPGQYAGRINEVELTFVANPSELVVVLEADKRGGLFRSGGDAFGRFHVAHQEAERTDWAAHLDGWISQAAGRMAQHYGNQPGYGQQGYGHGGGHPQHYRDHDDDHGRRGGGMGVGGMVAAGAAGVVGGFVAAEMIDEVGDFFGGDDE